MRNGTLFIVAIFVATLIGCASSATQTETITRPEVTRPAPKGPTAWNIDRIDWDAEADEESGTFEWGEVQLFVHERGNPDNKAHFLQHETDENVYNALIKLEPGKKWLRDSARPNGFSFKRDSKYRGKVNENGELVEHADGVKVRGSKGGGIPSYRVNFKPRGVKVSSDSKGGGGSKAGHKVVDTGG